MLARLIYYSENRLDPSSGSMLHALQEILATSRLNNARRELTGALAFDDMWFFQALEGRRDVLWSAFKTIMEDQRHGEVTLVECVTVETRLFGDWTMRLAQRTPASDLILSRFTQDGVVRPGLMTGSDILEIISAMVRPSTQPLRAYAGAA